MTLTPDERHAVAGELRWLARRREQNAVMSADWLRQRADWIEVSGERRAPERERGWDAALEDECDCGTFDGGHPGDCAVFREQRRADALDSIVLRWGEPRKTDHWSCCGSLVSHAMSCEQFAALQEGRLRQVGDGYEVIP